MKKFCTAIGIAFVVFTLTVVHPVSAKDRTFSEKMDIVSIRSEERVNPLGVPEASISTPDYPIGISSGESKLVEYSISETGNISGEITKRTLQFFTQYDVPLSEPMGPFPTQVKVKALQTSAWNELIYLPQSVVDKARSMGDYAIVLKTNFAGQTDANAEFNIESQLLLLLPPAAFSKSSPANASIVQPGQVNLKWNSSTGAVDYEYCIDTSDNNSCDTNWQGTYWLGTYDTNALLNNLPPGKTFYWQVRANNTAGTTYANNGKFWKFTSQVTAPTLFSPMDGDHVDNRRPRFEWSGQSDTINYVLQVSKTDDFSQIILTVSPTSAMYTPKVDFPAKTTLYWRVRIKNANGFSRWSQIQSFVTPNPPSIPVLVSPALNALITDHSSYPVFDWKNSILPNGGPGFLKYEIDVAEDSKFIFIMMNEFTTEYDIADSDITSSAPLFDDKKYYWRVRSINENGEYSSWSPTWYFRSSINPPILTLPLKGDALDHKRPGFQWEGVNGATGYKLLISRYANMSSPIRSISTGNLSYTLASDLPANTRFYWKIIAVGPNGPRASETWSFTTGKPPSVPVLVSPANGILIRDMTPLFNWNNSTTAGDTSFVHYQIQVDNDRDFSSPWIDSTTDTANIADSAYSTEDIFALSYSTKYYWRVRAVNSFKGISQFSAWAPVWSFRTALQPPALLAPLNDSTTPIATRKPDFTWSQVSGATTYTIQISTSSTFETLLVNATIPSTIYQRLVALPANKVLHWRVRANNVSGAGVWSEKFEFKTP